MKCKIIKSILRLQPYEDRGKDCSDAPSDERTPRFTSSHQKPEQTALTEFP